MDIVPPQLGCIKIYGKLTFLPNLNATIVVTCIEVIYHVNKIAHQLNLVRLS